MNRKVSSRPLLKPAELALEDLIKGTGYSVVGDGSRIKALRDRLPSVIAAWC